MMLRYIFSFVICALFINQFSCTGSPVAGGSSSTDNGKVAGIVKMQNNAPAINSQVVLLPASYDAFYDTATMHLGTTDENGAYTFTGVAPGTYTIEIVHATTKMRALIGSIFVTRGETTVAHDAFVSNPAALKIVFAENDSTMLSYMFLPGTMHFAIIHHGIGIIDSVPAGIIPAVAYKNTADSTKNHVIKSDFLVMSNEVTTLFDYGAWSFSKKLVLNTSSSGAEVLGNVLHFPVLVRLTSASIDFSKTATNGADIRFCKSDGSPLPFEIEQWDSANATASIWVKVDTVYGNNARQYIELHYGNKLAKTESSSENVFDTTQGFMGVWHLGETGNGVATDATMHHYQGTPVGINAASIVPGISGNACNFDGVTSYIQIDNTESGFLSFTPDRGYAISAWVLLDSVDLAGHSIVNKGNTQYGLEMLNGNFDYYHFINTVGWVGCSAPAMAKSWCFLTGVYTGSKQYLYINGSLVKSVSDTSVSSLLRDETLPVTIGKLSKGNRFFKGTIDEVWLFDTALTSDWVRLNYMNQRVDDKLIRVE